MIMGMMPRERILSAINHKEPDKVPVDFGAMRSTGIMAVEYNRLKKYLKKKKSETFVYDLFQQLAEPEDWIIDKFNADVVQLHRLRPAFGFSILRRKSGKLPDGSPCTYPSDFNPVPHDSGQALIENGRVTVFRPESSYVFYQVYHPLSGIRDPKKINKFAFPTVEDDEFEYLKKRSWELRNSTDRAILGAFGGNIIESGQFDFGYEEFLTLMITEPDLVHHYFRRLTDHWISSLDQYIKAVTDNIDIIQVGDDLGTQRSPIISPEMYHKMVNPYHKEIFQYIKRHSHYKVFLHSCGAIADLIPDLIDAGVDILNPVQTSAKGMDPVFLKKEFGKDITFWGGACETQTTLFNGTPKEVQEEAKKRIEIFAPGGGFVFTQIHNILVGVPPENIIALYETPKFL
jgi:uroporphyrinogen decarboxylase